MTFDSNNITLLLSLVILLAAIIYIVKLVSSQRDNTLKGHPIFSNLHYISGHPQLGDLGAAQLYLDSDSLILESKENLQSASIPQNMISEILVLDRSTILENDPTTLKLYYGWGLLASKLPVKKGVYLLVIKWSDQKQTYNTTFEFAGHQSARNAALAHKVLSDGLGLNNKI